MVVERIVVVPAAPALAPGLGADVPDQYGVLLARCDRVVADALAGQREALLVAGFDPPLRDLAPRAANNAARIGWTVAGHLLDRAGYSGARQRVAAADCTADSDAAVVVAADGSAATGPRSPRASRSGTGLDEHLETVLRAGMLAELAGITDTDAARVGCTTAAAWRAVAVAAAGAEWSATEVHVEVPAGVTSFVAAFYRRT